MYHLRHSDRNYEPHHFIRLLQAVLPMNVFDWLMSNVLGIYHAMDNFTGRKK